ncbi:MAG: hypothetical protein WCO64_00065 [Actinomycetes bacterium]
MESLALLVSVIFLGAIASGAIALGLSFAQRPGLLVVAIILGIVGILGGLALAVPQVGIGARIIGVACAGSGVSAIIRSTKKLRQET